MSETAEDGVDYKHPLSVRTVNVEIHDNGVMSRRIVGGCSSSSLLTLDPFLLLEHIGPVKFAPHEAVGAVDHPHRGLQVLNYVVQGGIRHADSIRQREMSLLAGGVQLIQCGRGLVHYEMPLDSLWSDGGVFEGFQLWINTPHAKKMQDSSFMEVDSEDMAVVRNEMNSETIHILAGSYLGVEGAVTTEPPCLLLDINLKVKSGSDPVHEFFIPSAHTHSLLYVWHCGSTEELSDGGEVSTKPCIQLYGSMEMDTLTMHRDSVKLTVGQMVTFSEIGDVIRLKVLNDCRILLLAGVPTREAVVKMGPFAMRSCDEIHSALEDFNNGEMGHLEGKEAREEQNQVALENSHARSQQQRTQQN